MLIRPNQTNLVGRVESVHPHPEGRGFELALRVILNESSDDLDFVRPAAGAILAGFVYDPRGVAPPDTVRARAVVVGGPGGRRVVFESLERLASEPPHPPAAATR